MKCIRGIVQPRGACSGEEGTFGNFGCSVASW